MFEDAPAEESAPEQPAQEEPATQARTAQPGSIAERASAWFRDQVEQAIRAAGGNDSSNVPVTRIETAVTSILAQARTEFGYQVEAPIASLKQKLEVNKGSIGSYVRVGDAKARIFAALDEVIAELS